MDKRYGIVVALLVVLVGVVVYMGSRIPKSPEGLDRRLTTLEDRVALLEKIKPPSNSNADVARLRADLARKSMLEFEEKYGPGCHLAPPNIRVECERLQAKIQ